MAQSSGNPVVHAVLTIKSSETKPAPAHDDLSSETETDADYIRRMLTGIGNTGPLYQLEDGTFACMNKVFDCKSGKVDFVARPISREYFKNYTQTKSATGTLAVSAAVPNDV